MTRYGIRRRQYRGLPIDRKRHEAHEIRSVRAVSHGLLPNERDRDMRNVSLKRWRKDGTYFLFVLPALVLFFIFFIFPFIQSIYYSFTNLYGYNTHLKFIGFSNYLEAFKDENFLTTLAVTFKYSVFVIILGNALSLMLALALDTNIHGRDFIRTVFFLPNVMSLIIVGFVWTFIYGDVFRSLMELSGLPLQVSWLGNESIAIYSIGITAIWQSAGYAMIIYIAGLQNIPQDIIEAANIDGADIKNVFFRIKLPFLSPVIVMNLILAATSCLKAFDFPLAMTSGGPGYATTTIALYIYTVGFRMQRTGYATALSILLFFIIAFITVLFMNFQRKREEVL